MFAASLRAGCQLTRRARTLVPCPLRHINPGSQHNTHIARVSLSQFVADEVVELDSSDSDDDSHRHVVEVPEYANFSVPDELIAQVPANPRNSARLLVVERETGQVAHGYNFSDLPKLLQGNYTTVVNNAVVRNCKFTFETKTDSDTETNAEPAVYILSDRTSDNLALTSNADLEGVFAVSADSKILSSLSKSSSVRLTQSGDHEIELRLVSRVSTETALVHMKLLSTRTPGPTDGPKALGAALQEIAQVPFPPYIRSDQHSNTDEAPTFQTIFAKGQPQSCALPAAGFHFTEQELQAFRDLQVCFFFSDSSTYL